MVLRTRCGWVKYIPVDKRVAHEKAPARKKWEELLFGKSAVRLRLMEERGNARQIYGLDRRLGEPWPNCHGTIDTWRNKKRGGVAESADAPDLKSGS